MSTEFLMDIMDTEKDFCHICLRTKPEVKLDPISTKMYRMFFVELVKCDESKLSGRNICVWCSRRVASALKLVETARRTDGILVYITQIGKSQCQTFKQIVWDQIQAIKRTHILTSRVSQVISCNLTPNTGTGFSVKLEREDRGSDDDENVCLDGEISEGNSDSKDPISLERSDFLAVKLESESEAQSKLGTARKTPRLTEISRMSESKPRRRGSSLRRAMEAVQNNQLNTNAAALKFNIPRRTLRNHLVSGNSTKIIGKTTILTKQLEEDLSQRIKRFAKVGVPLTPKFIRKQAFLFCERFKIKHSFNMSTRIAGRKWLKMFLARNPSISKRKPQLMNPARAQKMNKPIVKHHFKEVKELYDELDIIAHPERLYNMDEKGCRITVHKQTVVLAERGNTRVHLVAPEHAENVTIAMCVNAVGIAIPPMIIFKGIRRKPELASNLPPGTKVNMAPKGSMTSSLFVEFIQHLAQHKVPGKCLLIFDGAKCHLSYEALEEADKNNIVLYCLPSNTTHELQPLDKSVNRSFEHHWDQEVLNYLCNSQERTLNKAAFNKIFSRTWPKCMTQTNIMNGFKATGLYPFDPDVIPEDAYAPSIITERPLSETLQHQIDQPLISVQASPPVSEFKCRKC